MKFEFERITEAKDYLLTAAILLLSIALLIGRNQGEMDVLRKTSVTLFSYIEEPLSQIRIYRRALETNKKLQKKNILLLNKLNRMRAANERIDELQAMLKFKRKSKLSLYPVQIVGKSLNGAQNILTVDAGSAEGIEKACL